jgi:anti-sigma factor RsiW
MMRPFAKQSNCPTAATLVAYCDDALAVLVRQSVAAHLPGCEFCAAEVALLARHRPQVEAHVQTAPPVPLAVRLLAETLLTGVLKQSAQHRAA